MGPENVNSMFLHMTSPAEILTAISNLDSKKASGPDQIPAKVIKHCSQEISGVLSRLINMSFTTGVFPSDLKIAKVIPLHKKREKFIVDNYRPISLLNPK